MSKKTGYIAAIARGHNAGVCLLKDGEVVFSIEEERLSRRKYDGGPYASMVEILKYQLKKLPIRKLFLYYFNSACAAASRAIGTRNGEQLT